LSAIPISEPEIITQDREQLAYLLTEAAEIEHGLMCCYLFTAYSLKLNGEFTAEELAAVVRWRSAISSVAVEEMVHLALVSNLLTSIGFAPQFARPNFPVAPGYHPSGIVISLARFELATLDHFIYLERPEGLDIPDGAGFDPPPSCTRATRSDRLMPSSEDYGTVGHFYRGIRAGFVTLAAQLGEKALFVGDPRAQVGQDLVALPGLSIVTDLSSALTAIDTIVEQGEGTQTDSARSHYRRFLSVRDEYRSLKSARPDFEPAYPVARNPVLRNPPDPKNKVYITDHKTSRVMDLGNAPYSHALRILAQAFGHADDPPHAPRRALADSAIEMMSLLSTVAEMLCRIPAGNEHPGVNAGLSFAMARSRAGAHESSIWPLLIERTRELAMSCAALAQEIDPALEAVAARLQALATRLDQVSPVKPADSAPLASIAELPSLDTRPPAIEEALGHDILLRFEGKRCVHARFCVLGAPDVFRANVKGAWLNPEGASVEALIGIAHECPSGAITYERRDGGRAESPPPVNVIRIRENGPLAVHAQIELTGAGSMTRATLCRCGASKNKPFCDSSHVGMNFIASGEPLTQSSEPVQQRGGAIEILPTANGPLSVRGNLELCSGTGRTITRTQSTSLCRCGGSSNKPFCDGSHARIGFRSE
jgi:CDGSH-type Zn-finger protein/uncharacterized Fe-S cluster protein YjdI